MNTLDLRVGSVGGGTAIIDPPDGPYLEGTEVTVTAKPEGNWEFIGWSGDSTSSEATITITMDGPKTLKPDFERITWFTHRFKPCAHSCDIAVVISAEHI